MKSSFSFGIALALNFSLNQAKKAHLMKEESSSLFDIASDESIRENQMEATALFGNLMNAKSNLPVNAFSTTLSNKFTELTYQTIKNIVLPKFDILNPIIFCNKNKKNTPEKYEAEIYNLLLHAINTINPAVFDMYYESFKSQKYYECFLILQRLYSTDSDIERIIMDQVLANNKKHRKQIPGSISFVDVTTGEVCKIEIPGCLPVDSKAVFYLPKQVLKFEELVQFSFQLDEAILTDLNRIAPLGFLDLYTNLVARFYKTFEKMDAEKRILFFLRIKFFVFNSIGYSISYLSSGSKDNVYKLLIRTAKSENDAFFKAYALSLGLLNK